MGHVFLGPLGHRMVVANDAGRQEMHAGTSTVDFGCDDDAADRASTRAPGLVNSSSAEDARKVAHPIGG